MFDYNIFVLKQDDDLLKSLYQWVREIQESVKFNVYLAKYDERSYRKDTNLFNHFNLIILNNPQEIQATNAKGYKLISDSILKNKAEQTDRRIFMDQRVLEYEPHLDEDIELLEHDLFYTLNDTMQDFHVLASAKVLAVWKENHGDEETLNQYDEVVLVYTHSPEVDNHSYSEDLLDYEEENTSHFPVEKKGSSRLNAILSTKLNSEGFQYNEEEVESSKVDDGNTQFEVYGGGESQAAVEDINYSSLEEPPPYEDAYEDELPIDMEDEANVQPEYDRKSHLVNLSGDSKSSSLIDEKAPKNETALPADMKGESKQDGMDMQLLQNARRVQKELFGQQSWSEHKTIGVWSPVHKMGVTTFIMNYATFLAENRVYVGVLEALRTDPALKERLQRYSPMPRTWSSYAKTIHSQQADAQLVRWDYKNVLYLPLDRSDISLNWNAELLAVYLDLPSLMDITFVDMPTGEMNASSLKTLEYLTELWILVDDNHYEILSWYNYIHQLKQKHNIEIKLIFNKAFSFSPYQDLCNTLELPLLTVIPSLHEEMARNNYQNGPVISVDEVRQHLYEPFKEITKYLMGADFILHAQKNAEVIVPSMQVSLSNKHWNVFLAKLKRLLKALRSA